MGDKGLTFDEHQKSGLRARTGHVLREVNQIQLVINKHAYMCMFYMFIGVH